MSAFLAGSIPNPHHRRLGPEIRFYPLISVPCFFRAREKSCAAYAASVKPRQHADSNRLALWACRQKYPHTAPLAHKCCNARERSPRGVSRVKTKYPRASPLAITAVTAALRSVVWIQQRNTALNIGRRLAEARSIRRHGRLWAASYDRVGGW